MDIIGMIKSNPTTFIVLLLALIGYFYFDNKSKYGSKKSQKEIEKMTDEERAKYKQELKEEKYKKSKSKKTNYSVKTTNVYDERKYDITPSDGTSIHHKGRSGVKFKKKDITSRAMERLPDYKHYLEEVKETNLNHLARNMELINSDCSDDIYHLQKKGYFKNIKIDETFCRIIYEKIDDEEYYEDEKEEINDFEGINSPYEILKKDFEGEHVPGINITHICPHCGTPNIIDSDTKEYNCYYCLDKVLVNKKNKK